ncbi:serine/threonine protein kinase [Cystobacter fuscus DSM 2262]|uniref:Serine/threonine protein kinase n=1 Tax=Cystobacter fuscus (strain ATCC 25194 / DSM 2262 / NBRC 100088 / M29) TaxID=1242864 RepID=S9P3Z6_CYSF2|nr:serine/threonine-protein kinase [Cystobacter fuscus]EPX59150.1 serine/threonine protein kinase [Cystobacter fuscus DSM 2262]
MRDLQPTSPESDTDRFIIWQPGLTVGRYNLLTRLAVGGMAEIWLARQGGPQGFEKFIAIKRILDSLSSDADFVGMFLDEARLAAQLNHPHIVQIFDLGEEEGAYYIAMEYLPGENLASVARACTRQNKVLPLPLAVRIIAHAAEGLAYAHAKLGPDGALLGIVHRDVSPQNILVTYEGLVKVLDFGIAKAATRESQTMAGQVRGKAAYMSPEQARGQLLDARSDIFSLGIVLFELVTGTRLFPSMEPLAAMNTLAGETPLPVAHERNPRVPESLSRIISRALARQPGQRFISARHFQAALEEWLRAQPEVPDCSELSSYMTDLFADRIQERARLLEAARSGDLTPSSARRVVGRLQSSASMPGRVLGTRELTVEQPAPSRRPRWPWIAGAAVLSLLALSGGLFFALRGSPAESPAVKAPPVAARPPTPTGPPVLTIETEPPGAQLRVDGQEVGVSPLSLETLALGEHRVVASLEGRAPEERLVKLSHPGERTLVRLELPALGQAPPPASAVVPERPAPEAPKAAAPSQALAAEPHASSVARATKRAMGRLTLDTKPWTYVYLRGRKLGDTPLIEVPLPAGRHQLKLVNEGKNISTVIEVEIRAGQTTGKKLQL